MKKLNRIHHISAIVGNAYQALEFYQDILGLELVKQTVNFDGGKSYHLYFSSQEVNEKFLFTIFPWENAEAGMKGSDQGGRIAFEIPKGSLGQWQSYLAENDVDSHIDSWFDQPALYFHDKQGLDLALVEGQKIEDNWAILGFYGMMMESDQIVASQEFLQDYFDLSAIEENENFIRLVLADSSQQELLLPKTRMARGKFGPGTVHHIAFAVSNQKDLLTYRQAFENVCFTPTVVRDRKYFESVYLREPGKVIVELATEEPDLTVDERLEELGRSLQLPQKYENRRQQIEAQLLSLKR
ncbi:ring-cleaving dioxygenase [Streptococcus sp. X16XC17]|uniref:VOC family protein n=1 Tax=unclassified Streptococcus TaxID=2608887 RepID=UPI00066FEE9D|nr:MULTISPECIES: VOC family protein [unclassified Streptococcus]TCD46303.1 ring-cleaving dioxygenase [Streptococcus sp. X16XC17]